MYAEHFGFSKLPFSVTPDPEVFFNNSLYREAFAKLRYGILAKKGFILLTGEVGTGKTTLVRKLLYHLGPTVHSAFIFNTQVSFVELLRSILDELNLARENDDKLTMIEILNRYSIERLKEGHIVTLVIAEAQDLCDEALDGLRLLSNLTSDTEKLLQIVLMGQPKLEIKLDHRNLRQLRQRITVQCRLAPLKKEEVGAYIQFRLDAVGCRGKTPFERDSLEAIAFYSKGIPRLINVICDNALRTAFATSKDKVSAEMVDGVARRLQLGSPRPILTGHPVHHAVPANPVKPRMEGKRLAESKNVFVGAEKKHRSELQRRPGLKSFGMAIFLGAVFLGVIAISYTQPHKSLLSALAANWEDSSREGKDWTVKVKNFFEQTQDYFSNSAARAEDLSRRSKDYLAGLAGPMGETVRSHWKSLKQLNPITKTSEDDFSKVRLADSNDVNPSKRTEPLFGHPTPVAEEPTLMSQESNEPKQDNNAPLPEGQKLAERQIATDAGSPPNESQVISESSKVQQADSHQLTSLVPEAAPLESPSGQTPYLGNFKVVEKSFVRDAPQSDAGITTTLKPGTLVRVESKTGKYLGVRSLNDPPVHGYVHEEDAFFKRIK